MSVARNSYALRSALVFPPSAFSGVGGQGADAGDRLRVVYGGGGEREKGLGTKGRQVVVSLQCPVFRSLF